MVKHCAKPMCTPTGKYILLNTKYVRMYVMLSIFLQAIKHATVVRQIVKMLLWQPKSNGNVV